MASKIEEFVSAPSEDLLNDFTKEQLIELAGHYEINLVSQDKRLKDNVKLLLKTELTKRGILASQLSDNLSDLVDATSTMSHLTFEQQKQLLLIQKEMKEKMLEVQSRVEMSKLQFQQQQLDVERYRLKLIKKGKLFLSGGVEHGVERSMASYNSDLVANMRLVPRFDEKDVERFFLLFERVADARNWPDEDRTLILQSVFIGKAQEAYSCLSVEDAKDYLIVKNAVLRAYELVPEAYRQKFRSWKKTEKQTHVEFVHDISVYFNRWCTASGVKTLEDLKELMLLEQFKNSVSERVATYINERKPDTVSEAAVMADEFFLIHKTSVGYRKTEENFPKQSWYDPSKSSKFVRALPDRQGYASVGEKERSNMCNYCHRMGHWKNECPFLKVKDDAKTKASSLPSVKPVAFVVTTSEVPNIQESCSTASSTFSPFVTDGSVRLVNSTEAVPVKVLRDTGSAETFVLESVLAFSNDSYTGNNVLIKGIGLNVMSVPVHKVVLHSDLIQGEVEVAVRACLPVEGVQVILGNDLAGERVWRNVSPNLVVTPSVTSETVADDFCSSNVFPSCVTTRSMTKKQPDLEPELKRVSIPLEVPSILSVSRNDLIKEQKMDSTLAELFDRVVPYDTIVNLPSGYYLQEDVLCRKWVPHGEFVIGDPVVQVVVPQSLRQVVLKTAHDTSGHLGVKKTYKLLLKNFFWPKLKRDVSKYIKSCQTCQLTGKPNQSVKPAPLYPIPAISQPFEHLIVDCVGPLPKSKAGNEYLLTVMCQVTRYPAVYPLRSLTAKLVLKALTQFISIFGIPRIIQSDQGSNFTSHLFNQVLKQLHIQHSLSSAFHPQSQGALERFHQTLKSLLRSYCVQMGKDWETGLPWLMMSAREAAQESTGFSPNDLVFGHNVRGPLSVLSSDWKKNDPPKNVLAYVSDFRRRIFEACQLAKESLGKAQDRMKRLFDRRTELRSFQSGDQVLALLPIVGSPFQAKFAGPYTVARKISDLNYLINTPDRKKKTQLCHVNLLKPFYGSECSVDTRVGRADMIDVPDSCVKPVLLAGSSHVAGAELPITSVLIGGDQDEIDPGDSVLQGRLRNSEALSSLHDRFSHLTEVQRMDLISLIFEYIKLFPDTPSCTKLIEHDIDVGDSAPIRQRYYRVSANKKKQLEIEIDYMLENNIIEPSFSSWASPSLLVNKPDGSFRFCTDYRKVNAVTKPDSFPLPRIEDCVDQVGNAKFVSKFDLLKGYWQVPLTDRARDISAFVVPSGLFSYKVMSFGLRNAPATFQRLMNRVISGLRGCAVYLDDVIVYSQTWDEHIGQIRALFDKFLKANLTVNLLKCEFAKATVVYLGKVVGQGQVRPVRAKVEAVNNYPTPTTKKELMRFLGMVGFYRCFCRNFSTVVAPLTNLLRAGKDFCWTLVCQQAFEKVKMLLTEGPVLKAPRFDQPFRLQVDASNVGAGAVLLQTFEEGIDHPVSFFSKKFNSYQLNYSVIEKEALALIWALQHFEVYVGSAEGPLVVFTDHNPLVFLHSLQNPNQRLMRWCLFLQGYLLDIRHIKGSENVIADALSRA